MNVQIAILGLIAVRLVLLSSLQKALMTAANFLRNVQSHRYDLRVMQKRLRIEASLKDYD